MKRSTGILVGFSMSTTRYPISSGSGNSIQEQKLISWLNGFSVASILSSAPKVTTNDNTIRRSIKECYTSSIHLSGQQAVGFSKSFGSSRRRSKSMDKHNAFRDQKQVIRESPRTERVYNG
jgi:hypothetical protein